MVGATREDQAAITQRGRAAMGTPGAGRRPKEALGLAGQCGAGFLEEETSKR